MPMFNSDIYFEKVQLKYQVLFKHLSVIYTDNRI